MGLFSRRRKKKAEAEKVVPASEAIRDIQEVTDPSLIDVATEAVKARQLTEEEREATNNPVDTVKRLSVAEAERWGRLDAEIRNALQGQRILTLEIQVADTQEQHRRNQFVDLQNKRRQDINGLEAHVANLRVAYQEFTKELARKYQIDLPKLVIDPETRIVREAD